MPQIRHLSDAVMQVMADSQIMAKYPRGITGREVLEEIRKNIAPFPLVSTLDVIDELRNMGYTRS